MWLYWKILVGRNQVVQAKCNILSLFTSACLGWLFHVFLVMNWRYPMSCDANVRPCTVRGRSGAALGCKTRLPQGLKPLKDVTACCYIPNFRLLGKVVGFLPGIKVLRFPVFPRIIFSLVNRISITTIIHHEPNKTPEISSLPRISIFR